jgi:serine/threonine protein kinase
MELAGKYQVLRKLGNGSAGEVFLVKHPDLNVNFALKVLHKSYSDNSAFIEQFKREAEVLLRFSHKACVQLRDFGRLESGSYYMATDFCEGETLRNQLRNKGAFSPTLTLNIMSQLLSVLASAHEAGIVHRDIKPDNIMVVHDAKGHDHIKVLDFGIAHIVEFEYVGMESYQEYAVGTPTYMAPEQAYGDSDLDYRVDLYAASVLAYELFTGTPPFVSSLPQNILLAHVTQEPPPFAKRCNLPEEIECLVLKGLEKGKDNRYQSADDYLKEVKELSEKLAKSETITFQCVAPAPVASVTVAEKRAPRILLLDDEESLLSLTKHILEFAGFEVFAVSNVAATHRYLVNDGVDLLITDVQMPDMPGWKVCKLVKETLPDLKVILFSNLDERELERLKAQSGADAWMSKRKAPKEWIPIVTGILKGA